MWCVALPFGLLAAWRCLFNSDLWDRLQAELLQHGGVVDIFKALAHKDLEAACRAEVHPFILFGQCLR